MWLCILMIYLLYSCAFLSQALCGATKSIFIKGLLLFSIELTSLALLLFLKLFEYFLNLFNISHHRLDTKDRNNIIKGKNVHKNFNWQAKNLCRPTKLIVIPSSPLSLILDTPFCKNVWVKVSIPTWGMAYCINCCMKVFCLFVKWVTLVPNLHVIKPVTWQPCDHWPLLDATLCLLNESEGL